MNRLKPLVAILLSSSLVAAGCGSSQAPPFPLENEGGAPAEQQIGERLFVDTRFAEYFAAHMTGVNDPLLVGDPVVSTVQTTSGSLPGPFRRAVDQLPLVPFRRGISGRGRSRESHLRRFHRPQPDSAAHGQFHRDSA